MLTDEEFTHWYPGTIPRPCQVAAWRSLMDRWGDGNVHVLRAPVGSGKSHVAVALARWATAQGVSWRIVVPNRQLQLQYERDFPELRPLSVWGQFDHWCTVKKGSRCGRALKLKCSKLCAHECPYKAQLERCKAAGGALMSYHMHLGIRKQLGYPQLLIIDEGHLVTNFHQERGGTTLWRHKHRWPLDTDTLHDAVAWLDKQPTNPERAAFRRKVLSEDTHYVTKSLDDYYDRKEWALKARPLSVHKQTFSFWPRSVEKIVVMSATYRDQDVVEQGLAKRGVWFHDVPNPIPASQRQVVYWPCVNMRHGAEGWEQELAIMLAQVATAHRGEAGFVHLVYARTDKLRRVLTDPRFMWHDRDTKQDTYKEFIETGWRDGRVLVASGMTEGIDLAGDKARWQVIAKVPYPDRSHPAVALKAEQDPEWYAWETIKTLLQAYGRVCRGPNDTGVTYIPDMQFKTLYDRYEYMFPPWFREAILWP